MVQRKIEKTAGLFIAIFILLTALVCVPDWYAVSLHSDSSLLARCAYPLFHASFLHAALNAWCFLSIVFLYDVSWLHILAAYIIAILAPPCVLSDIPTVGLSAVCFALLGIRLFRVRRPLSYLLALAPYLFIGFVIPYVNGRIHFYAFLAGVIHSFLNAPLICRRK